MLPLHMRCNVCFAMLKGMIIPYPEHHDHDLIDWHVDFRSGYRWHSTEWYRYIPFGHAEGVDIKLPWELGRMQHLPQLAWAYTLAVRDVEGMRNPSVYLKEYQNQVLDFIAMNPPRFGVQWVCAMDVAIRAVNLLVARDLFITAGAEFDTHFEEFLGRYIYDHGLHIVKNLEWFSGRRSNHYLANICGLVFISSYLLNNC